jgi:hypothetical protein
MSDKVIVVPDPGDPEQGRAIAERHTRLICHLGLGGGSYAFDIWSRVTHISADPAKVLPFTPRSVDPPKASTPGKRKTRGPKQQRRTKK